MLHHTPRIYQIYICHIYSRNPFTRLQLVYKTGFQSIKVLFIISINLQNESCFYQSNRPITVKWSINALIFHNLYLLGLALSPVICLTTTKCLTLLPSKIKHNTLITTENQSETRPTNLRLVLYTSYPVLHWLWLYSYSKWNRDNNNLAK